MNENNQENPWKTLTSEIAYESPWIKISKHDVINPSGNKGIYSVVHFKNLAIGILPLDDEYNAWIVGQYRFPTNHYSWEIPEGGGQHDVEPIESAKRELLEETGIKAEKWTKIQELHLSNSATDEFGILYIAQGLSFHESEPEDSEQLEVKKLPFKELYKMVTDGTITDALTIITVLKTKIMIDEGKI
jgi:8-oxo-dGTP pyrophosphatase MutT (NUDIX family)